jgi:hypothetical protein
MSRRRKRSRADSLRRRGEEDGGPLSSLSKCGKREGPTAGPGFLPLPSKLDRTASRAAVVSDVDHLVIVPVDRNHLKLFWDAYESKL